MSTFDDREAAYENKFAYDEATKFKIAARANRLLGLWVAGMLGKDDAESYALEVIKSDFEEAGHEDVVRKVAGDLGGKATEGEIRAKLVELTLIATEQVTSGV